MNSTQTPNSKEEPIFIGEHKNPPVLYTECWCNSAEHSIRWYIDDSESVEQISFEIFLNPNKISFWQRLKTAVRFLFKRGNYQSAHFDEFFISNNDVKKIKSLLEQVENIKK